MKELFSNKTHRILNMAKVLVVDQKNLEIKDVMTLNNCSLKTAYDDINYARKEYGHIITGFSNGIVSSNTTSVADLMVLKREMFHSEPKLQILLNIALYPDYKTLDHSVTLDFSESFIRNQIKIINDVISRYNVFILYDDKTYTYQLVGKHEISVILFLAKLVRISSSDNEIAKMPEDLQGQFDDLLSSLKIEVLLCNEDELDLIGRIATLRQQQGFIHSYEHLIAPITMFYDEFAMSIKRNFLEIIKNRFVMNEAEQNSIITTLIIIAIKINFNRQVIDSCFNRYDYFYESVRKKNPKWCAIYEKEVKRLEDKTTIEFSQYTSKIFFSISIILINKTPLQQMHIGVYSDFGKYHEQMLITILENHFNNQSFVPYKKTAHYDFVISTTSRISATSELIIVSDMPSSTDISKIYNILYYDDATNDKK